MKLTLADYLSISRIPLGIVFFIFVRNLYVSIPVFILVGLSDVLDGYFARKSKKSTPYGSTLDPLMDKFFTTGAFLTFVFIGRLYWYEFLLLIPRDIYTVSEIIYVAITKDKKKHKASVWGKMVTLFQFILIVVLMFNIEPLVFVLVIIIFAASLLAIFNYVKSRWFS